MLWTNLDFSNIRDDGFYCFWSEIKYFEMF